MKTRDDRGGHASPKALALALLLTPCLPAGAADIHQSAGSTAVIEQGGGGASRFEVTVYPDGQRILTEDGRSTDLTIQRGPSRGDRSPPWSEDWPSSAPANDRFGPPGPPTEGPSRRVERSGFDQEAFRERMIERMRLAPAR